jgi:hypothetical protein
LTTIARFEPKAIPQADTLMSQVLGLSVLRFMLSLDPPTLAKVIPVEGDVLLEALPGLFPGASAWVESLPETFLTAPSREQAIATEIMELLPEPLRREFRRITPNLARALRWMASRLGRTSLWLTGVPPGGRWTEWCGGQA